MLLQFLRLSLWAISTTLFAVHAKREDRFVLEPQKSKDLEECDSPSTLSPPIVYAENTVLPFFEIGTLVETLSFLFHIGCRPNGFLGLSLNDMTILFLLILLDQTVSVR